MHDAVRVRQSAVTDTRILGVLFHDIDACNEGFQDVLAFCHALECELDAGDVAAVLHRHAVS